MWGAIIIVAGRCGVGGASGHPSCIVGSLNSHIKVNTLLMSQLGAGWGGVGCSTEKKPTETTSQLNSASIRLLHFNIL